MQRPTATAFSTTEDTVVNGNGDDGGGMAVIWSADPPRRITDYWLHTDHWPYPGTTILASLAIKTG